MPIAERFFLKVDFNGPIHPILGTRCWLWTGCCHAKNLYGQFKWDGSAKNAHRFSYILAHGEVPEGLVIDHLCRVRPCVNPDHLEAVTTLVNNQRGLGSRKTCCKSGHKYTIKTTIYKTNTRNQPYRACRVCNNKYSLAAYYRKKRAADANSI